MEDAAMELSQQTLVPPHAQELKEMDQFVEAMATCTLTRVK